MRFRVFLLQRLYAKNWYQVETLTQNKMKIYNFHWVRKYNTFQAV